MVSVRRDVDDLEDWIVPTPSKSLARWRVTELYAEGGVEDKGLPKLLNKEACVANYTASYSHLPPHNQTQGGVEQLYLWTSMHRIFSFK